MRVSTLCQLGIAVILAFFVFLIVGLATMPPLVTVEAEDDYPCHWEKITSHTSEFLCHGDYPRCISIVTAQGTAISCDW